MTSTSVPDGAAAPAQAVLPPTAAFALIVPLFNEERRFLAGASRLAEFIRSQPPPSELVFVDDGSTDGTPELVERFLAGEADLPARLVRRPHAGKGAAVHAGLEVADAPVAAFCDVDLATPLADVRRLVEAARAEPALVIGSRDVPGANLVKHESRTREALGKSYNRAVRVFLSIDVSDTQCGAKAARREVWRALLPHVRERGFAWDVETIAVAGALGVPVRELGVEWAHDEDSRVKVGRDGAAMLRALPAIRRRARRAGAQTVGAEAAGGGVFDEANADALAASDSEHWWFRGKAAIVSAVLRDASPGLLVDIGAGAGGVTAMLDWPADDKLTVEGNADLVRLARERHGLEGVQADVTSVPLADRAAAVVCLLDVIEHLPEPAGALAEARRLLGPGGRIVVTVPAHPRLWSAADEALGHARRYTRASLREALESQGFEVLHVTHVYSWLFVPVWLKRRVIERDQPELGLDVSSPLIDRIAAALVRAERAVALRRALPFGTSVLAVGRPRPDRSV